MSKYKDIIYIKKAIDIARGKDRAVAPNPTVACLLVKNDRIISKAFHKGQGTLHAERAALIKAGREAAGSTLYVNLEPCCHWGRNPPCTDIIIESKVKRVVYSLKDPNEEVNGKGAKQLQKAGIDVSSGICAEEAFDVNESYFVSRIFKRPLVSIKFATSADGFVRDRKGVSKWITGEKARHQGRRLRSLHAAVTVGTKTILEDDPQLTARILRQKDPLRVVLDKSLRIPGDKKIFADGNHIVFTSSERDLPKAEKLSPKDFNLKNILNILYCKHKIISLLVEGGPVLASSFIREELFDYVYHFIAPYFLGEGLKMSNELFSLEDRLNLARKRVQPLDEDFLIVYKNLRNKIKILEDGCLQAS
ncbi:bifunctional diaminohydroxyphosphoribosylaminopyrimidine deaminase/5-amino-6-(5-phosphoribosylamino)uracil reductase RibD [candidate division WOR-3 bacterium]|nr:bifunctional diaminohydroxyphosphoribosylaminopyrimidine deaminase/5-amino-6-(5-phosphoribosylamino)uracil reductase RibD [candidate division WOR-3 bacterium]